MPPGGYGVFCYHREPGLTWFRVFGVGLVVKDTTRHSPTFSERMGLVRRVRLGRWTVSLLRRDA